MPPKTTKSQGETGAGRGTGSGGHQVFSRDGAGARRALHGRDGYACWQDMICISESISENIWVSRDRRGGSMPVMSTAFTTGQGPATPGQVFSLIRDGRALTRSDVGRLTGLSRTAVAARLGALLGSGLVVEGAEPDDRGPSTGGRPPVHLRFNRDGRRRAGRCDRAQPHPARGVRPRRRGARVGRPRPGGRAGRRGPDAAGRGGVRGPARRASGRSPDAVRAVGLSHPRHRGLRPRRQPGLADHGRLGRRRAGAVPAPR